MDLQSLDKRFADYVRPILARKWMILLAVVIATGGVYAYYKHKPNVYRSSTLVYVQNNGDPVTGDVDIQQTDRQVEDQATLLDSISTATRVAKKIHFPGSAASLLGEVAITSLPGEDFVTVTVHDGTAEGAATVANGFAREFVDLVNGANNQRIAAALRLSREQLAQLGSRNPQANTTAADLIAEISRLTLAQKDPEVISKQVQLATPPAAPSAPKPTRNAIFALALSLLAAVAAAFGLERFDRRLKNPEEMERAYGRTLLTVLPHSSEPSPVHGGDAALSQDFREPFRVLRTNIELETLDAPPRTIVVSSAMPGEGKSTVVRNLALAFRESGKSVAVVDLDLRHPSIQRLFGLPNLIGVTDVLRHEVSLDAAMVTVPVELDPFESFMAARAEGGPGNRANGASNGSNGHNGTAPGPSIKVLTTGPLPANPAAVLASDRAIEVIDELRDRFDVVIIDSAPVLAVSDSVSLLRNADVALFVGRLNVTTRDTAKRLMDVIARVPDMVLAGVVANDLSRLEAGGYGYGYGYDVGSSGPKDGGRAGGPRKSQERSRPFSGTRR